MKFSGCCNSHLLTMMNLDNELFILVCGDCFNPIYVGKLPDLSNNTSKNYGIIENHILDIKDFSLWEK